MESGKDGCPGLRERGMRTWRGGAAYNQGNHGIIDVYDGKFAQPSFYRNK
jgi:hypothetical protein